MIIYENDLEEPVTQKQLKYLFGKAKENRISENKFKAIARRFGYFSRKNIKQKDVEKIVKMFEDIKKQREKKEKE